MIDPASLTGPLIGDPAALLVIGGVQLSRYADLYQWLLHFIQTVLLLVTSLFLVYPLIRHPQNVAHSRGVGLLALGFLLLSGQWAMEFVSVPDLVAPVLALTSAASFGAGCWEFASSFVDTAERIKLVGVERSDSSGGFGDDSGE